MSHTDEEQSAQDNRCSDHTAEAADKSGEDEHREEKEEGPHDDRGENHADDDSGGTSPNASDQRQSGHTLLQRSTEQCGPNVSLPK